MPYLIQEANGTTCLREPTVGGQYVMDTARDAQPLCWDGGAFITHHGEKASPPWHHHLIELAVKQEVVPNAQKDALVLALRWLDTLIKSPAVTWDPEQRRSAEEALARAQASI